MEIMIRIQALAWNPEIGRRFGEAGSGLDLLAQ
jgi:hypothetical protein